MISKAARIPAMLAFMPGLNLNTKDFDKPDKKYTVPAQDNSKEDGWDRVKLMFKEE
jgi:hypothetical protein